MNRRSEDGQRGYLDGYAAGVEASAKLAETEARERRVTAKEGDDDENSQHHRSASVAIDLLAIDIRALLPAPVPVAGGEPKQEAGSEHERPVRSVVYEQVLTFFKGNGAKADAWMEAPNPMFGYLSAEQLFVINPKKVLTAVRQALDENAPADSAEVAAASEDATRLAWKRLRAFGRFSLSAPPIAATTAASVVSVFSSRPASPPPPTIKPAELTAEQLASRVENIRNVIPPKNPAAFAAGITRSDVLFLCDLAAEALRLSQGLRVLCILHSMSRGNGARAALFDMRELLDNVPDSNASLHADLLEDRAALANMTKGTP